MVFLFLSLFLFTFPLLYETTFIHLSAHSLCSFWSRTSAQATPAEHPLTLLTLGPYVFVRSPSIPNTFPFYPCKMGRFSKYATPEILPKKERLTVTQLAGYDDILTDALVDHVCDSLCFVSAIRYPLTNRLLGLLLDYDTEESIKIQFDTRHQRG